MILKRILSLIIFGMFLNLTNQTAEAVNIVSQNIVKADMQLQFAKLEKDEKHREPTTLGSDAEHLDDPWILAKEKEALKEWSIERQIRIDFVLKNIGLKNYTIDKKNKYEYPIFKIKWPVFASNIVDKKSKEAIYTVVSHVRLRNSKVLVQDHGYFFLRNSVVMGAFQKSDRVIETYETEKLQMEIIQSEIALESHIISDKEFDTTKTYNIEGHCVYGGSLISSAKAALWYPFDRYLAKFDIVFPFEETDLELSINHTEDFVARIVSRPEKDLGNFSIKRNQVQPVEILFKRKHANIYLSSLIASVILILLPTLIPTLRGVVIRRVITYLFAIALMCFAIPPAANIPWLFPIRFAMLLLSTLAIAISECIYWLKSILAK